MAEEKETLSFSDLAEETNADTEKKPAKKMNFVSDNTKFILSYS